MKIILKGHAYKYACEQMLLTMFPQERPEYVEIPGDRENRIEISLAENEGVRTAECRLTLSSAAYTGTDTAEISPGETELERDRVSQRLIKNALYRAALSSGVKRPPWGALTGVRPGKVLCRLLDEEENSDEALQRFIDEYDVTPERAELCMKTSEYTLKALDELESRDICLYVGIPFCPTRCAYCSFVSQSVEKSMKLIEPFMDALMQEIEATGRTVRELGLRPVSVYFGGGTPTTLSAPQLERLCGRLAESFDLSAVGEYTVEAGRPDTISEDKLRVLKRFGITRVSVNPQTMSDSVLETIGRRHTAADIVTALGKVRAVGGFEVNMDLIAGLPSDSVEGFENTLKTVIGLAPENITVHTLSLKKGSRITLEDTPIPDGEAVARMLDISQELLKRAEYEPYYLYRQKFMSGGFENVGWTKKGSANLYNICIMEEICSIIAMGGGGSTKLVKPGDARNIRLMAPKYPLEYIESIEKTCSSKQKITDYYREEI